MKTARKYHAARGNAERIDIIGFAGSFHGRTYAAVNAAGNPAYLDGFGPRLPGYIQLSLDDQAALEAAIARSTTAAVIVEPVQGEGGARALSGEWLKRLRALCDAHGVLLIRAAAGMTVGAHGSTFGGNSLAMAVAAFDEIAKEETLAHAREVSAFFVAELNALRARFPDVILEVRGKGMLLGLKLVPNNRAFMALARDQNLLVAGGGENCVRLLPPLNPSFAEAATAVARLEAACAAVHSQLADAA